MKHGVTHSGTSPQSLQQYDVYFFFRAAQSEQTTESGFDFPSIEETKWWPVSLIGGFANRRPCLTTGAV